MSLRIGYGEDAHALAEGRALVIGGVTIENSPVGAVAHSDGDVLLHALSDALLSAFALGDIGTYFPPSNPQFKDLASHKILEFVMLELHKHTKVFRLHNMAAVVTLDKPKLGPHRQVIQEKVAGFLGIDPVNVGITFKTSEGLARGHIQARVTVLVSAEVPSAEAKPDQILIQDPTKV